MSPSTFSAFLRPLVLAPAFFACSLFAVEAQTIQFDVTTGQFSAEGVPLPKKPSLSRKTPYWGYFWEFGDGYYSYEKKPVHRYEKKGSYAVRLQLTPFYAVNPPMTARKTVHVNGASTPSRTSMVMGDRFLRMESNTGNQVLAGQNMRVMVHYAVAAGVSAPTTGRLFIFYNKDGELPGGFQPFRFVAPDTCYFGEMRLPNPDASIATLGNAQQRASLQNLRNQFKGAEAFQVRLQKGQPGCLFFTLEADKRLEKYRDKKRQLALVAVWAPDSGWADESRYKASVYFPILSVYDPNRLKAKPDIAYYHKKHPVTLHYELQFQNMGEGEVRHATIAVPVDKSVSLTAASDVRVLEYTPACRSCGAAPFDKDTAICMQTTVRLHPAGDSIFFTFYNIGLEGKKGMGLFQSKRSTKGEVVFDLQSSGLQQPKTKTSAFVDFLGASEIEETNTATVRWRQKGIFIHAGVILSPAAEYFEDTTANVDFHAGVGYDNAPVGSGFSLGAKATLSQMQLARSSEGFGQTPAFPNSAYFLRREKLTVAFLDLEASIGFKAGKVARIKVGAGTSIPAFGRLDTRTTVFEPFDETRSNPIQQVSQRSPIGFFRNKAKLPDEEVRGFGATPGLLASWGIEVGLINDVSVGFGGEYRYIPGFYNGECLETTNWNAVLRVRLAALAGN